MKILSYPSLQGRVTYHSQGFTFWCQLIIPASSPKFLSMFPLLHLKQITSYFRNIPANSTPKCHCATFDHLTAGLILQASAPPQRSLSHIPGRASFSVCVTTGLALCFQRFHHTLQFLFAFLFFLLLNFPAWHPHIFSP